MPKRPIVIRIQDPDRFPSKPMILYTSNNELDIVRWATGRGAAMVWIYKLRYTHGDSMIGAILSADQAPVG